MRDDQQCVYITFFFTILLFLTCVCVTQVYPANSHQIRIREGTLEWDQFFSEPFEILVFIFKDQTWISFDTGEEHRVNIHPSTMINEIEIRGKLLKDVATIIHNHPIPTRFSVGNNMVFRYFKSKGFDGYFMIYYPFSKKTRVKKDG